MSLPKPIPSRALIGKDNVITRTAEISSSLEISTGSDGRSALDLMAVIPARGSSKGIPRKNIASVGGVPLIAYSIMAARNCRFIQRVLVSTDCPRIAAIAREWGAEVPFLRPSQLAGDRAVIGDALKHIFRELSAREQILPKAYVLLYPTNPFRTAELMDTLCEKLLSGYDRVFTARAIGVKRHKYFAVNAHGKLIGLDAEAVGRRYYRRYGLFDGINRSGSAHGRSYTYIIRSPIELVDIDTPADLATANRILERGDFTAP